MGWPTALQFFQFPLKFAKRRSHAIQIALHPTIFIIFIDTALPFILVSYQIFAFLGVTSTRNNTPV